MITDKIKKLAAIKVKALKLEAAIKAECNAALGDLPAQYGFDTVAAFAAAVKAAAGVKRKTRGKVKKAKAAPKAGRKKRAKITDAIRAKVEKLVEEKKSGSAIAKAVGISLPSVQNIKKTLGLVQPKKK